jgi:hypothetical protein
MDECTPMNKQKILEKRKMRKRWQNVSPQDKAKLNKTVKDLKQHLNDEKQTHFESLTTIETTEYSLWKATKRLKRPQI